MNGDRLLSLTIIGVSVGMLLYAWIRYRVASTPARVKRERGTFLLGEKFMSVVYHLFTPVIDWLALHNTNPNLLTWLSLPLGAFSGIAAATGVWSVAALMLMLSGLCDLLDGAIARKQGKASHSGALLDSMIDRYVEFFVLLGISLYFFYSSAVVVLAFSALFGSLLVTYSTAKAEALQMRPPRGFMKRPERITYLFLGLLVAPWFPSMGFKVEGAMLITLGIIALFANLSAVIRMRAIYKQS